MGNNLKVDFIGSIDGGTFDKIDIDGVVTVKSGLHAETVHMDGVVTVKGDLAAESVDIDGVVTVKGSIDAEKTVIDGVVDVDGDMTGSSIRVEGVTTIKGNIRGTEVTADGMVTIEGERIEADTIKGDGCITVKGEINADEVNMEGYITANAIFGDRVVIQGVKKPKILKKISEKYRNLTENTGNIKLIEATYVEIDRTNVDEINAQEILIHKDCHVQKAYATRKITIEQGAKVGEISGDAQTIYI